MSDTKIGKASAIIGGRKIEWLTGQVDFRDYAAKGPQFIIVPDPEPPADVRPRSRYSVKLANAWQAWRKLYRGKEARRKRAAK